MKLGSWELRNSIKENQYVREKIILMEKSVIQLEIEGINGTNRKTKQKV